MINKREEILIGAAELISGDRAEQYGDADDCYRLAYQLYTLYFNAAGNEITRPAHDAMMFMIFVKIARIATAKTYHEDNYIDIAGYIGLMAEGEEK